MKPKSKRMADPWVGFAILIGLAMTHWMLILFKPNWFGHQPSAMVHVLFWGLFILTLSYGLYFFWRFRTFWRLHLGLYFLFPVYGVVTGFSTEMVLSGTFF